METREYLFIVVCFVNQKCISQGHGYTQVIFLDYFCGTHNKYKIKDLYVERRQWTVARRHKCFPNLIEKGASH